MNSESPYYVTTNSGKLQLTKGAYLTLMKRKNSVAKTLQKSKSITHSYKQSKKTVKKPFSTWKQKMYNSRKDMVLMTATRNNQLISKSFIVKNDRQVFNCPMIPNIPLIQMQCDNDCDSEWPQIYDCINNLSMSLSLAIYDHTHDSTNFI